MTILGFLKECRQKYWDRLNPLRINAVDSMVMICLGVSRMRKLDGDAPSATIRQVLVNSESPKEITPDNGNSISDSRL